MEPSFFKQLKEAFARDARRNLERLGIKIKGKSGSWLQGLCPCGQDKSGSASYTHEGFLKCHQCGKKEDLCAWLAEQRGCSAWAACQDVCKDLGIDTTVKQPPGARAPKSMTPAVMRRATHNLWEQDQAESVRRFLQQRNAANPGILENFGVGFLNGYITFAQFTAKGMLRPRYRRYTPGGQLKWTWSPGRGETQGFWPYFELPPDGSLLLLEGEWDVLTAWSLLCLQDQGIFATTWTGGAGAPIPGHMIPEEWRGRRVDICYDNDTFQGPDWASHRAPDATKLLAMERRRKNLLEGVAARFAANKCDVRIRAVPIDPLETFGADLRDWAESGRRNIDELTPYDFKDLRGPEKKPIECEFLAVYEQADHDVIFQAEVGTIDADGVTIPRVSFLQCDMNNRPQCSNCLAPTRFPDRMIPFKDYPRELSCALNTRNPEQYLLRNVVGKPSGCPQAEIIPAEYVTGSKWTAIYDDPEESNQRDLSIISETRPTLSGDVRVSGHVYHSGSTVMVMADHLEQVDKAEIDLAPYINDFKELCPRRDAKAEDIEAYFAARATDFAANVTKIYGRPEIHIAHDLLAHSAISMYVNGQSVRGWVDIGVIGDTRTGKSITFKRMIEHSGLGTMHTCIENISRAGLTMGASREEGRGTRLKPGLFPRCHRKLLILDEFHFMVENARENPLLHLQSARDEGRVHGVKIYGSRSLPAKVRFAGIGNWGKGDRSMFRFPCEHFLHLYGAPESVSRMDFGLTVQGDPEEDGLTECEHIWNSDLTRSLILRAWAQDEEKVQISDPVFELAHQICLDWKDCYSNEELPLFTAEEKVYSLLRLAISTANICFSHPVDDPYTVDVRLAHVEWAAEWLKRVWHDSGYDDYSKTMLGRQEVVTPYEAEASFTVTLDLADHSDAANILENFIGRFNIGELAVLLGMEHALSMQWLNKMVRRNVFRKVKDRNLYNVHFTPTKGGNRLLRNLLSCAEDYPAEYVRRQQKLKHWSLNGRAGTPDLLPLTLTTAQLFSDWNERLGGSENLLEGPGA